MGDSLRTWCARLVAGACALVIAGASGGCGGSVPSRAEVEADPVEPQLAASALHTAGVLTVGVDPTDAPQVIADASGALTGYEVDVARALAERLGLEVRFVEAASAEGALADEGADVYIGATEATLPEGAVLSDPVLEDASALFVSEERGQGGTEALDAATLAGGTVGVQMSSASQDALARLGADVAQKTYANVNECFEALERGEVTAVACDATAGAYLARAYPGVRFSGIISSPSSTGIACAGEGELVRKLADALSDLAADGTLEALHTVWYGALPFSLAEHVVAGVELAPAGTDSSQAAAGDTGEAKADTGAGPSATSATRGDVNALAA